MREKAKLFRALLLEPLELRAVFSADGLVVWQCVQPSSDVEYAQLHLPHTDHTLATGDIVLSNDLQAGIQAGHRSRGPSQHKHVFDIEFDMPLPPAEGEGRPHDDAARFNFNPLHANPPTRIPNVPSEPGIVIVVDALPNPSVFSPPREVIGGNIPRIPADSGSLTNVTSRHTNTNFAENSSTSSMTINRVPTADTRNFTVGTPAVLTSISVTQANLAIQNPPAMSVGTATFDFSTRLGSNNFRSTAIDLSHQRTDEFHFTKPLSLSRDSVIDPALLERASGVASLESLLSDLAENHRRQRTQNGFDANQPDARSGQNWRPEHNAASVEIAFAEGGMIALALNRDIAFAELEDNSEVARQERRAWVANVGIYRAFENGAVAVTEHTGLTNRTSPKSESQSIQVDWPEVESEIASTPLHPLLASTSAALGLVIFGLRRIRKSVPLMYTSRKP